MPLGELGGIVLTLTIMVVIGSLWFHMVEGLVGWIKGLFTRRREPPAWHPLAPEDEKKDGD